MVANNCIHYWILESVEEAFRRDGKTGRFSKGSCKHCGEEREDFDNSYSHNNPYGGKHRFNALKNSRISRTKRNS